MQVKFNIIDDNNLFLLREFIYLNKSNYFRYYLTLPRSAVQAEPEGSQGPNKPSINTIAQSPIKNHLLTIILTLENDTSSQSIQPSIIGYAHLDKDLKDEYKIWFGIYVLEDFQSKGYGKTIINYIFQYCRLNKIEKIYLSVDKDNEKALIMYQKNNFIIESEGLHNFIMYKTF